MSDKYQKVAESVTSHMKHKPFRMKKEDWYNFIHIFNRWNAIDGHVFAIVNNRVDGIRFFFLIQANIPSRNGKAYGYIVTSF